MRSSKFSLIWLALVALLAACGGKPQPAQPVAPEPAAAQAEVPAAAAEAAELTPEDEPGSLLGYVAFQHPVLQMQSLAAFVDAVEPGAGTGISAELMLTVFSEEFGAISSAAIDLEKPLYLLFLDGFESQPVLVAAVADGDALSEVLRDDIALRLHRGYAAIGPAEALSQVSAFALTRLRDRPLSPEPSVHLRSALLMERYGTPMLAAMRSMGAQTPVQAQMLSAYADGVESLMNASESLRISIAPSPEGITVSFASDARPDTDMATFIAAQKPSPYALVGELAQPGDPVLFGGELDFRSVPDLLDSWSELSLPAMFPSGVPPEAAEIVANYMRGWSEAARGDFAMNGSYDPQAGLTLRGVFGVDDADAMRETQNGWLTLIKRFPKAMHYSNPRVRNKRAGNTSYTYLTAGFQGTPEERKIFERIWGSKLNWANAVSPDRMSLVMGPNARADLDALLKAKPAGATHEATADSQARRESLFMYFDVATLVAMAANAPLPPGGRSGIALGLGFEERTVQLRISVPVAQIEAFKLAAIALP
ncbi:hypothetical protein [Haliangium ochraceum]|uniref:Lipoprotein n=1 Tax=Haliangium ochraceum (strain DSM 14365 / JCM 11303 / SMP-2) TaxID=502025 RepID=D0LQ90_HALO1|nr:hypothetical protein [Haliangium ochraceum]ACY18899.1 hypothetical protein Hoch_6430 [Haliangium ochraceum DSM 14365]